MASYAITGASRGIGLELTKQLLDLPASQVAKIFALTRSSSAPAALQELIKRNPDRVVHVSASVDDTDSVQKAAEEVKEKLGGQGLDILVNNAGLQTYNPGGTKAMPPHELSENLNVNVIGVHRMIAAFLPLLEMGKQKKVINL
jgi:NAD(P)-dependent dehydrogenase (short-subunit alcohol dehydrogenase family)